MPLRTAALSLRISPTIAARHASTSAHANPINAAAAVPQSQTLDWDSFLRLRRLKRRYNLVSSIFTSIVGTSIGMGYLANKEIDVTQSVMGMDPLILFGLATMSCSAAGWLAGPAIGGQVFGLMNRRWTAQIAEVFCNMVWETEEMS